MQFPNIFRNLVTLSGGVAFVAGGIGLVSGALPEPTALGFGAIAILFILGGSMGPATPTLDLRESV